MIENYEFQFFGDAVQSVLRERTDCERFETCEFGFVGDTVRPKICAPRRSGRETKRRKRIERTAGFAAQLEDGFKTFY